MRRKRKLELDDHLPYLMNRAGSLVIQLYSRDLAPWELTVPMWRVLAVLQEHGAHRLTDLSVLTAVDVSTLSRIVGAMTRKSFVTRSVAPDNRREVVISLTPEGRAALAKVVPIALAYEDDITAGVSAQDLAATKRTLKHVFDRLLARAGVAEPAAVEAPRVSRRSAAPRTAKSPARK